MTDWQKTHEAKAEELHEHCKEYQMYSGLVCANTENTQRNGEKMTENYLPNENFT